MRRPESPSDTHRRTAEDLFCVVAKVATDKQRWAGKAVNFTGAFEGFAAFEQVLELLEQQHHRKPPPTTKGQDGHETD